MKALLAAMGSAVLSSLDPGCSATAGANVANRPGGSSYTPGRRHTSCARPRTFLRAASRNTGSSLFDGPELFAGKVSTDGARSSPRPTSSRRARARMRGSNRTSPRAARASRSQRIRRRWTGGACIKAGDSVETGVIGLRNNNSYWVAVRHGRTHDAITEAGLASSSLVQSHVLQDNSSRPRGARRARRRSDEETIDHGRRSQDRRASR